MCTVRDQVFENCRSKGFVHQTFLRTIVIFGTSKLIQMCPACKNQILKFYVNLS